jgi:hypothetical protein
LAGIRFSPALAADEYSSTICSGSENGSGFNISAYTDEKIADVAPMHSASVTSVVAVMRFDFHSSRVACRKSIIEPAKSPAEVEAEEEPDTVMVQLTLRGAFQFRFGSQLDR